MIRRFVLRDRARAEKKKDPVAFPYMTEKMSALRSMNTVALTVPKTTTKIDIQTSFMKEQNVKVSVNTILRKGKVKRVRGVKGQRQDWKIALVTFPADFKLPELA